MLTNEEQARWEAAVTYEVKKLQDEIERLQAEISNLEHDIDRHMTIAMNEVNESKRLRAVLKEIVFMSGMPIDIPPQDMLANAGATAMTALNEQQGLKEKE